MAEKNTYFIDKYHEPLHEFFVNNKWNSIVTTTKNSYNSSKNDILKFSYAEHSDVPAQISLMPTYKVNSLVCEYTCNMIDMEPMDTVIITSYFLLINGDLYYYNEGKVYPIDTRKRWFFSKQEYFKKISQNISNMIYKKIINLINICDVCRVDGVKNGDLINSYFKFICTDVIFRKESEKIELLRININPDLTKETDKCHKMKLHHWMWKDFLDCFIFNKNTAHRWIQMKPVKTYHVNTSRILKSILERCGWNEANVLDTSNFSSWDDYNGTKISSNISIIPRRITHKLDNKKIMYNTLITTNPEYQCFLPKTYVNLKNIKESDFQENKLYFIKKSGSSGGIGVNVVKTYKQTCEYIKDDINSYILQEEIRNPHLINGYKYTLRVYILITEKKEIYIHRSILGIIHTEKYSNVLNKDIHISHKDPTYFNLYDKDEYDILFNKIQDISFLSIKDFIKNEDISNRYIILGTDFLVDMNMNVYLLEFNTYPNMQYKKKETQQYMIKRTLFIDFVNLYLRPRTCGKTPRQGGWILCNPLYESTHFQKNFKSVYDKDLWFDIKDYCHIQNKSNVISLNHWTKYTFDMGDFRLFRYMNKQFIEDSGCKRKMYEFMKKYNLLKLVPQTYNNIDEIIDKSKRFYIKPVGDCAQRGIYRGDYEYIVHMSTELKDTIIQDQVLDTIFHNDCQVSFSVFVGLFHDEFLLDTDICIGLDKHSVIDGNESLKTMIHDDISNLYFEDLKMQHDIIKNNIQKICVEYLREYYLHMNECYNICSNEVGYARIDLVVEKTKHLPKIIEVNSLCHDNMYNKTSKSFFEKLYNHKLYPKLYNLKSKRVNTFIYIP